MTADEKLLLLAKAADREFPMQEFEIAIVVIHAKSREQWTLANRRGDAKYAILAEAIEGHRGGGDHDRSDLEVKGN